MHYQPGAALCYNLMLRIVTARFGESLATTLKLNIGLEYTMRPQADLQRSLDRKSSSITSRAPHPHRI